MKKIIVLLLVMGLLTVAGKAMALDSANMTVNATVLGTCGISSAPTINLTLDPSSGRDVTGNGNIDFICTNGTGYTLAGPAGGTMTGPGNIIYALGYTNLVGVGTGLTQTSVATVTVPYANYATVPAGAYTETVVVTINP